MENLETQIESRPNLFSYATSELSQDAFICWLAAWADPKYKSIDALHEAGQEFVMSMIHKGKVDYDKSVIRTVNVRRQVGKLDVLIEINEKQPDQLALLVEDKTHTSNHSDQLNRYYGQVKELGYDENQMVPLYFKTGYQSRFDTLGVFKTYLRKDFLSVLRESKVKTSNAIFHDFLNHLEGLESAIQQFSTKKLEDWDGNDWQGLFMVLYKTFGKDDNKTDWGYVPNASGGFFGFWWDFWGPATGDYWSYLQWENDKLCYKIGYSDEFYRAKSWKNKAQEFKSLWSEILLNIDPELSIKSTKIGQTMTVAKLDNALSIKADGKLDLEQTIAKMIGAQEVLKEVRQRLV